MLDLPSKYKVNDFFNVCDLIPFVGRTHDEVDL